MVWRFNDDIQWNFIRNLCFVRLEEHVKSFSWASSSLSTVSLRTRGVEPSARRHFSCTHRETRVRVLLYTATIHALAPINEVFLDEFFVLSPFLFCFAIALFKIAHCPDATIAWVFGLCFGWRFEFFFFLFSANNK